MERTEIGKEIPYWKMKVGLHYIVTNPSTDKTFIKGDHIKQEANGDITSIEGQGWIDSKDVPSAADGMVVIIDTEYGRRMIESLQAKITDIKEQYRGC